VAGFYGEAASIGRESKIFDLTTPARAASAPADPASHRILSASDSTSARRCHSPGSHRVVLSFANRDLDLPQQTHTLFMRLLLSFGHAPLLLRKVSLTRTRTKKDGHSTRLSQAEASIRDDRLDTLMRKEEKIINVLAGLPLVNYLIL